MKAVCGGGGSLHRSCFSRTSFWSTLPRGAEALEMDRVSLDAVNLDFRTFMSVFPTSVLPSLVSSLDTSTYQPENSSINHALFISSPEGWVGATMDPREDAKGFHTSRWTNGLGTVICYLGIWRLTQQTRYRASSARGPNSHIYVFPRLATGWRSSSLTERKSSCPD